MTHVKCRSQSSEMLATFPSKRMTSFNMAGDQWRNICGAVELVGRQGRVVCDITFIMFAYKLPASASICQQSYAYHNNHWSSKLKSMQPYLLCPETINWFISACAACAAPVSGGALGMHSAHGLEKSVVCEETPEIYLWFPPNVSTWLWLKMVYTIVYPKIHWLSVESDSSSFFTMFPYFPHQITMNWGVTKILSSHSN
jgi:hypothetical protein